MDLLATVTGYLGRFLLYMVLITLTFVVLSIVIYILSNRKKWLNVSANDKGFFKALMLMGTLIVSLVIGVYTGFQISVSHVGLQVLDDVGENMLTVGLAQASSLLGTNSIDEKIEVAQAQSLLSSLNTLQLFEPSDFRATLVNQVFDRVKAPFVEKAQNTLNHYAPDSTIVLAGLASHVWSDVYRSAAQVNRSVIAYKIIEGMSLLLAVWAIILLVSYAWRRTVAKGVKTKAM